MVGINLDSGQKKNLNETNHMRAAKVWSPSTSWSSFTPSGRLTEVAPCPSLLASRVSFLEVAPCPWLSSSSSSSSSTSSWVTSCSQQSLVNHHRLNIHWWLFCGRDWLFHKQSTINHILHTHRNLALSSDSVHPLSQLWHPSFSPLNYVLNHTTHTFSESVWHVLSTADTPVMTITKTHTKTKTNQCHIIKASFGNIFIGPR